VAASSVRAVVQQVSRDLDAHDVGAALRRIFDFVERIVTEPLCTSLVYGSPELDACCEQIGRINLKAIAHRPTSSRQDVAPLYAYLVTRLQKSGGHTRVLEDLIAARPSARHLIVSTELCGRSDLDYVQQRLLSQPGVRFVRPTAGGFAQRLSWLQRTLLDEAPEHTYLFNHHQDSVAVSALPADIGMKASFYHHGDHHLCLGVHLAHLAHVDLHPMGYHQCRALGIDNVYMPLTVADQGARPAARGFRSGPGLVTCTAARSNKVEIPYFVRYAEVVPALIEATGGTHLHVGRLSPWLRWEIARGLRRRGIPAQRFGYIDWVPSVWRFLQDRRVDLYVASFPYGGGLTLIEAMGAGVPVALHNHIYSRVLSGIDLAYPEAFVWKEPEELYRFCAKVTAQELENASTAGRQRYDEYHRREVLVRLLDGEIASVSPPADLSARFHTRQDEWAAWVESQARVSRVAARAAYRLLRRVRALRSQL
jgi:hypothetical protein